MKRLLIPCALAALTAGCASGPRPCPDAMPERSTKGGVTLSPYRVEAPEQMCLQAYEWKSEQPVKGVVVVVHGLRDHALRYEALAESLNAKGLAVYAQDNRGHGRSGGDRQRFDTMDELVAHVDLAVSEAKKRNPGVPVFLYGHSLGGLIGTHYVLAHPQSVQGLVLSGAALKLMPEVSGGQQAAARIFGAILPGLKAQELDDTQFVRTPEAKAELAADPLVDHFNLPARSAAMALNAIEAAQKRLKEVAVPVLIMHGTMDKATNVEGSRELYAQAQSKDKTLKLWDGLYHDLLHEPERAQVAELVTAWVVDRLPK